MTTSKGFVKSAGTAVPAARSRMQLEALLRRYGCIGFGVSNDYEAMTASVSFLVPDSLAKDAARIPVRLVLNIRQVYDALYGQPLRWDHEQKRRVPDLKGYREKELLQAERVAWRQLILWVDAACSAAASGVQKMSEAFFAHTVVIGPDGARYRLIDHVEAISGGNWRGLLPPGSAQ